MRDGNQIHPLMLFALAGLCSLACHHPSQNSSQRSEDEVLRKTGSQLEATPTPSSDQKPKTADSLRLATWNIEWLNAQEDQGMVKRDQEDYEALRKYAQEVDPDIVSFQEVDGQAAAQRIFPTDQYNIYLLDQPGPQDTGFAVRSTLSVRQHPPVFRLNVGSLRAGIDISIFWQKAEIRLLSVHLKSGCFSGDLERSKACKKLGKQLPVLEQWIDDRQTDGANFAVMGDFNRRFFSEGGDPMWAALNDGDPQGLELWSPTKGQTPHCHGGKHREFIDHIVMNRALKDRVHLGSFSEHLYGAASKKFRLSDHCMLSLDLNSHERPLPRAVPDRSMAPSLEPSDSHPNPKPIKGNISRDGRHIYHLHHCPGYKITKIEPKKGERWFSSEDEARRAGWSRAANCR